VYSFENRYKVIFSCMTTPQKSGAMHHFFYGFLLL
jgi:hypothetical protein